MIYDPIPYNRCIRCEEIKPWTREHFKWSKNDGIIRMCRVCERKRVTAYRETHLEKVQASRKVYYGKNKEAIKTKVRQWTADNRERSNQRSREWAAKHPERRSQNRSRSYYKHRDKKLEYGRQWRRANKPKVQVYLVRRRARRKSLPDTYTAAEWTRCLTWWQGRCAYCGNPPGFLPGMEICQEHIMPLDDPDSPGTVAKNIIPACKGCNSSKGSGDVREWLKWKFGERKASEILARIEQYADWIGFHP